MGVVGVITGPIHTRPPNQGADHGIRTSNTGNPDRHFRAVSGILAHTDPLELARDIEGNEEAECEVKHCILREEFK